MSNIYVKRYDPFEHHGHTVLITINTQNLDGTGFVHEYTYLNADGRQMYAVESRHATILDEPEARKRAVFEYEEWVADAQASERSGRMGNDE